VADSYDNIESVKKAHMRIEEASSCNEEKATARGSHAAPESKEK